MLRRDFIKTTAAASIIATQKTKTKVRLAFIGTGLRGRNHVEQVCYRPDVEVVAIADIDPKAIAETQKLLRDMNRPEAKVYSNGPYDYENLLKRGDLDGVIISTPWRWHTPQAVSAMKAGLYTAIEVPAAVTVEECWDLVRTHEETGSPCMMLENVCYRRDVMAAMNMVRQGIFGDLAYMHCGYQHSLLEVKFDDGGVKDAAPVNFGEGSFSEAVWRTSEAVTRNGDIYPTHGLGPVAQMLNIERGNRFVHLTATATKPMGLHNYIVKKGGKDHKNANINFKLGDVVTSVIQCHKGENIVLIHDTNLPRPYSLGFRVQGTEGIWEDEGSRIFIDGKSKGHGFEPWKPWQEQYDHPLWKTHFQAAENAGHGGMDFFVVRAFVESIKRGEPTPMNVYDAAAWSVVSALSERSIAEGSAPQLFPDFSKGKWKTQKNIFAMNGDY